MVGWLAVEIALVGGEIALGGRTFRENRVCVCVGGGDGAGRRAKARPVKWAPVKTCVCACACVCVCVLCVCVCVKTRGRRGGPHLEELRDGHGLGHPVPVTDEPGQLPPAHRGHASARNTCVRVDISSVCSAV